MTSHRLAQGDPSIYSLDSQDPWERPALPEQPVLARRIVAVTSVLEPLPTRTISPQKHHRIRFSANDPNRPTVSGYAHLNNQANPARTSTQGSFKSAASSAKAPQQQEDDLSDREPDFVFKIRTTDAAPLRSSRKSSLAADTTVNDRLGKPNVLLPLAFSPILPQDISPSSAPLTEDELRRLTLHNDQSSEPSVDEQAPHPRHRGHSKPATDSDAYTSDDSHDTSASAHHSRRQPARQSVPVPLPVTPIFVLPEGWIAHVDQASGVPYYIHLATQATQWELPTSSTLAAVPVASPIPSESPQRSAKPVEPGVPYRHLPAPTFTSTPRNGVYFGPYLRYTNMDLERGLWLGSILLATHAPQPPAIHLHQTADLSPDPRELKANPIYRHTKWKFYRYEIAIDMEDQPTNWVYAVSTNLNCARHEFLVAGRHETSWRFVTYSANDFAPGVSVDERQRLGGVPDMWKDIRQKHDECNGFHVQLGLGGQICGDRVWQDVPVLANWTRISNKELRRSATWNAQLEQDVLAAYFFYYTSHFDQPQLSEALAQIPAIFSLDDSDIFDGYGSYPDTVQYSNVFKHVFRIAIDMWLLFTQHTTHEILRHTHSDLDIFTNTGAGWHFIKYLGPAVVVVGPDTRSERTAIRVMAGQTYQGLFPRIAALPPSVQHCIWMVPPLLFPRFHGPENIAQKMSHIKQAVHNSKNMIGSKSATNVRDVVTDGFLAVKRAIGKSGLMSSMTNTIDPDTEVIHEIKDMWTDDTKDLERTYLLRTLQKISHNKSLRMTFLGGGVNCAGAGFLHDPDLPGDHKTAYQIIVPSLINAPSSADVLKLLDTEPEYPIYIPLDGQRSVPAESRGSQAPTDTKEDMLELFVADPDGTPRESRHLMNRRGYVVMVAYDPAVVEQLGQEAPAYQGMPLQHQQQVLPHPHHYQKGQAPGQLCLAADFLIQSNVSSDGIVETVRYGPVVVPSLTYGN